MQNWQEFSDQLQEDVTTYLALFPNVLEEEHRSKVTLDLQQIILNRIEEFKQFCLTSEQ
jgi:hypothetical protein